MVTEYDRLVVGAVDLHCHVDVEFSGTKFRKAMPEWEWLPRSEVAGVRGVVLKSHMWPTMQLMPFLRALYDGSVDVFGSVTLNSVCGGLDPWVVEVAAEMGARVVFLPTWGSCHDLKVGGFSRRLEEEFVSFNGVGRRGLALTDENGRLVDEVHEILRIAADSEMVVSTGHASGSDALAVAREARRVGFERVVFGHPLSGSVAATAELVETVAAEGAFIEFCWPNIAPGRHDPMEVVDLTRRVGASRVVFSSDYFRGSSSSPSDLLRLFLGSIYDAGLSGEEVHRGASINPGELLGV